MNGLHRHPYEAITTFVDGHQHNIRNISGEAFDVLGHTHILSGRTSYADGHSHPYSIVTDVAIPVGFRQHIHYFSGFTNIVDGHAHGFSGYTDTEIG